MKKVLTLAFLFFTTLTITQAQFDANKIFAGVNFAYANPNGDFRDFAKGGFAYTVSAGYPLTDNIGLGAEYIQAFTIALQDSLTVGTLGTSIFGVQTFCIKSWFRFSTGNFRPYLAVGVGPSLISEPNAIGIGGDRGKNRIGFGGNAELGLNIKGFILSYCYHLAGRTPKEPVFNFASGDKPVTFHRFSIGYMYNF